MSDRPTRVADAMVNRYAHDRIGDDLHFLAREVQASRKLIADLRALPYTAVTCELLRQMIDRADL